MVNVKKLLTKILQDINGRTIYSNVQTASNVTLVNCTGTTPNTLYFTKSGSGDITVWGRITITNFVRTGANAGISFTLPDIVPTPKTSRSIYCGIRGENPREYAYLTFTENSRVVTFRTSESYSNASDGTLTLLTFGIPIWQ